MRNLVALGCVGGILGVATAQGVPAASPAAFGPPQRGIEEWLERLQQGATIPSYVGTYVVTSASGAMSSARIWHACEGRQQLERVDTLSGAPRSTFRRNDEVTTLLPRAGVIRTEQRQPRGIFPSLLRPQPNDATTAYYQARELGEGRVAGLDADVVLLSPRDSLRFGYRVWSERQTGLVLKTQTLDAAGHVLEQAAFSEVRLNPPLASVTPHLQPPSAEGLRVEHLERERVDPAREGWVLKRPVAGFQPLGCYRRQVAGSGVVLQWVFSDGLATISLFIEPFDPARHHQASTVSSGATHALARRWPDAQGQWWLTLVGEVPQQTLAQLVDGLARDDQ